MSKTDDDILFSIAELVRKINYFHPFWDGNIRTLNLIIFKLLKQNNLSPSILHDPNCLDTHPSYMIAEEIKKGQRIFQEKMSELEFAVIEERFEPSESNLDYWRYNN